MALGFGVSALWEDIRVTPAKSNMVASLGIKKPITKKTPAEKIVLMFMVSLLASNKSI